MELVVLALGAGAVLAVATGGSLRRLLSTRLRLTPALFAGAGLQALLELWDPPGGWSDASAGAVLLVSYGLVLAFCAANLRLKGMAVVTIGVSLNALVVLLNQGIPTRLPADATAAERQELEESVTARPEHGSHLAELGRIVPVPEPVSRTVSFGDLVVAVGLADVVWRASGRRRVVPPPPRAPAAAPAGPAADGRDAEEPALVQHPLEPGQDPGVVDVAGGGEERLEGVGGPAGVAGAGLVEVGGDLENLCVEAVGGGNVDLGGPEGQPHPSDQLGGP